MIIKKMCIPANRVVFRIVALRQDCSLKIRKFFSTTSNRRAVVDLRSDTVTSPTPDMLSTCLTAHTGDDVYGEDPTVQALQDEIAEMTGKEAGLFVPTGTMANLCAVLAHCATRRDASIIIGAYSHLYCYEGGNVSIMGNIATQVLYEDLSTALLSSNQVAQEIRHDDEDDHTTHTRVVCVESTHNLLGGVPVRYDEVAKVANANNVAVHVDGARLWNTSVALNVSMSELCHAADTISLCLSKGLGAPLGSVLVGPKDIIRRARRVRKQLGGGMRQSGVVAAMGRYAIQSHYPSVLKQDHDRARHLASVLQENDFMVIPCSTNMVYFQLPQESVKVTNDNFQRRLETEHGVRLTGGYKLNRGDGNYFRAVTHLDVSQGDIEHAAQAMVNICRP